MCDGVLGRGRRGQCFGGELATVAGPPRDWGGGCGHRAARHVVHVDRREHRVEGADAQPQRRDPDHLERYGLSERRHPARLGRRRVVYGPERLKPAIYSASPVLADGKIYVTNEEGLTSVFRAGPTFELLEENPSEEYTLSTIAVSKGQLFLRTEKNLYAIAR